MWVKDKHSDESYIHICNGLTEKQMRKKGLEIRLHDVNTFIFIKDDSGTKAEYIKFCSYCGIELTDVV